MMDEELGFKALYEQYQQWKESQQFQQDAYAFEHSFDVFCQQMNKQLLEMATAGQGSKGKKKCIPNLGKSA